MAESLRKAAQALPPEPDREDIPDRLARESDRTVPSAGTADSEDCLAAKKRRDKARKKLNRVYKVRIRPAEKRANDARVALDSCLADLGGCGADADRYVAVAGRSVSTARSLQRELDSVGVLEAKLFPLSQEVSKACGLGRY
jgi:hypothetical protein